MVARVTAQGGASKMTQFINLLKMLAGLRSAGLLSTAFQRKDSGL